MAKDSSVHTWTERPERQFRKVICIMPAYNAASTLEKTFGSIPAGLHR